MKLYKKLTAVLLTVLLLSCCLFAMPAAAEEDKDAAMYTALLLDVSGSMNGTAIAKQKEAAISFCKTMSETDARHYVCIISFNENAKEICAFTNDLAALTNAVNATRANGGTNTNAALLLADTKLKAVNDSAAKVVKNIVLCSDGIPEDGTTYTGSDGRYTSQDHYCYAYANAAYNTAKTLKRSYDIYTLGFFHNLSGDSLTFGQRFMKDLQSDGYFEVQNPDELVETYEQIANEIIVNQGANNLEKLLEALVERLPSLLALVWQFIVAIVKAVIDATKLVA